MISVLSATEHDYYAMPLPFAVYSWHKLGVQSVVFIPSGNNKRLELAKKYCGNMATFFEFKCEEKRIPTYSQVIRLFAAAIPLIDSCEQLITGDSDMCVFQPLMDMINPMEPMEIIGSDLTNTDQLPMCYIKMSAHRWKEVFGITKTYQDHVSELIDPIEGQNIRGEQWCYDQWYAKKKIAEYDWEVVYHKRTNGNNQFAQKRADRDGWSFDPFNIIDAHLPRPLTDEENFKKVYDLFKIKYPNDNLNWMNQYYEQYIQLL